MSKFNSPVIFNGDFAKVLKSKLKLGDNLQFISAAIDPTAVAVDAPIGSLLFHTTTGMLYKKQDNGSSTNWLEFCDEVIRHLALYTNEPTGFVSRTSNTISWNDGALTFTLGGTSTVFVRGVQINNTIKTVTWTDTEGVWYIYQDIAGILHTTQTWDTDTLIVNNALIASHYWDATNKVSILRSDERHGLTMDSVTHAYLHTSFGSRYVSGLALNSFLFTSGPNTAPVAIAEAQFGSDAGSIQDEDLHHSLAAVASTTGFPVFYKSGASGAWRRQATSSVPTIHAGGATRIQYNNPNAVGAGVWGLTPIGSDNDFMCIHLFATNDVNQPVIAIAGQAEYLTTADARTGATQELNSLILAGFPSVELKAIGTVIYQTNDGWNAAFKCCKTIEAISGGADYVDWRNAQAAANLAGVTDHGSLSGLSDDDHLQYAKLAGRTGDVLKIDDIDEFTTNNGVDIESVRLKDGSIELTNQASLANPGTGKVNLGAISGVLSYYSNAAGTTRTVVNTSGTQSLSDKTLTSPKIDTIVEETAGNGVTIDGLNIKDNDIPLLFNSLTEDFNLSLAATGSDGALTVTLKNGSGNDFSATDFGRIAFRSATATSSVKNKTLLTSGNKTLVIPSTATLGTNKIRRGTSSAVTSRFYVYAIDTDGTTANMQLGISKYPFNDSRVRSTTAIDTASNSSAVIYSTSAVSNKPVKMIGIIEIPVTTPGTWVNANMVKVGSYRDLPIEKLMFMCPIKSHTNINSTIETVLYDFTSSAYTSYDNIGVYQGSASGVEGITCPVAGHYRLHVTAKFANTAAWTAEELIELWIYNSVLGNVAMFEYEVPTTATQEIWIQGTATIKCLAGELLETRLRQNSGSNLIVSSGYINIELVNEEEQ